MNHILAKTGRKFYKLISDEKLFSDIEFNGGLYVDYDSDHNLDEDHWFKIEEFSTKDFCLDILKLDFDSKEFDELDQSRFDKIKVILSVQSDNYYFQKTTSSLFIKKKFIFLGDCAKLEKNSKLLLINSNPDAVYFKKEDVLIFRDLAVISNIFKGIDILYKEATDSEVKEFFENDFVIMKDDFTIDKISKPNRRRITKALDILRNLDDSKKESMISYINSYCSDKLVFNTDKNYFEISTDEQLKNFLYGIDQRFYTTAVNEEKRLANSVIKI